MSVVFRVFWFDYDGSGTLRVFADRDEAISYARAEARTSNEEFTGHIGMGVGIEALDSDTGAATDIDGWADWTARIDGGRFVVATDEREAQA